MKNNKSKQGDFEKIYEAARQIPEGCVTSYGRLARLAGLPNGARTAGWAMMAVPDGWDVPAHRVVHADGSLCVGHEWEGLQRQMLIAEGVAMTPSGKVNMARHLWQPEAVHGL